MQQQRQMMQTQFLQMQYILIELVPHMAKWSAVRCDTATVQSGCVDQACHKCVGCQIVIVSARMRTVAGKLEKGFM